jgi:hypothetical protein
MCLPADKIVELTSLCRAIMITVRHYTTVETADDHLVVVPRPSILYASPINGCTDEAQCEAIEDDVLTAAEVGVVGPKLPRRSYTCAVDPTIGGPARCITTCAKGCDDGTSCDDATGRCVLGPIPPAACVAPLQRYELHAGDAFSVLSSEGEYPGRQKVDAKTGLCVEDTTKSPLILNRFHRIEPPCTDLTVAGVAPNPCLIPDLTEPVVDNGAYTTRPAYAIRVRSPGISFDVTDVAVPFPNRPGVLFSPILGSFTLGLEITAGFTPYTLAIGASMPERIHAAPDGSLLIVDSGSAPNDLTTGQVLIVAPSGILSDLRLR